MKQLLLVLAVFIVGSAHAQMVRQPLSVKYAGLGAYSYNFVDPFSITSNTAALAQLKSGGFGVYGERRFLMQELNQYSAVVALPTTNAGTFAVQGDYFGFSDFNESQVGLAYARKIAKAVDIGAKFNYHMVRIAGYGNATAINFEVGTMFHLTDRLHTGVHVYNPLSSKIGTEGNSRLGSMYRVGLGYEVSDRVLVSTEIVKQEDMPVSVNAGLHYNVQPNIFIRAGISTHNNNSFVGAGIRLGTLRVDVNTAYHPQLGFTPGVLLLINFKKLEQQ
ncbi:hypothetical protein [Aridibaculum aurantiacum]|uniref:hypothetical protein n=1 Tax=Aridibaculum aurantiacum TaxID=2810307 RepID=UPI001A959A63|nr:hypothetical protein [Aridibaculum aurantiacum]